MFRIDPHQARTDLYGIGKGAAQVIDFSKAQEAALMREKQEQEAELRKKQLAAQRGQRVMSQLSALNKEAVLPRDEDYFNDKKAELYENVKSNWNRIENNDTDAILSVNKSINDLLSQAELSKNLREYGEKYDLEFKNNPRNYREDSKDYFYDFLQNKKNAGNYQFDPSKIKREYNFMDYLKSDLLPTAIQGATDNAITKTFTEDRAKELIKKTIATDPKWLDQAQYDFERDPDKYGAKDAVEYYMNKYAPSLIIDRKHPSYYTGFGGGAGSNKPTVASTITRSGPNDWEMTLDYTNKANVKPKYVEDPNDPNKSIEITSQKLVKKGKDVYFEAFTAPEKNPITGAVIPGHKVKLPYDKYQRIAKEDFGVDNPFDIVENKTTPEHMDIKRYDFSKGQQQAGGKQFNSLSKEEKIKIQQQSGAKTQAEFVTWLKNNGYK